MTLLEMSFSGAVFISAVVVIRTIAIYYLPKKTFLLLWEMVLLRLIIPFTIPSAFSVYTLISRSISISTSSFREAKANRITSAISQEDFGLIQGMEQPITKNPSVSVMFVIWCAGMVLFTVFLQYLIYVVGLSFRQLYQSAMPM